MRLTASEKHMVRMESIMFGWLAATYIAGYIENRQPFIPLHWSFNYSRSELQRAGVYIPYLKAFCESVIDGTISCSLQRHARQAADAFYALLSYASKERRLDKKGFLKAIDELNLSKSTSNPAALLRLAFREAVQALSYTPPTLSKKETVADAPHSS